MYAPFPQVSDLILNVFVTSLVQVLAVLGNKVIALPQGRGFIFSDAS